MASYHITVKTYNVDSSITSDYKALYISREGKYKNISRRNVQERAKKIETHDQEDENRTKTAGKLEYINREGKLKDTNKAEDLIYKENGKMPSWAKDDHNIFWKAAEDFERENANVFRELEFALPNELTLEQQKEMITEFIQAVIPTNTYSYSIHNNPATLAPDIEQPHVHLIFCERMNDGIDRPMNQYFRRYNPQYPERGGAKKDRAWAGTDKQRRRHLREVRKTFADIQNKYLKKYNHEARVDHRTLKAQREEAIERGDTAKALQLDRPPERKLGPKVTRKMIAQLQSLRNAREQETPDASYTEEAQEQDIYGNENLNPKVAYNFTVRKMRRLAEEIKNEYEKNTVPEPPDISNDTDIKLPRLATVDSLQKITAEINARIVAINEKISTIEEQKKALAPQIITELAAERAAWKRYLDDREKIINDVKENLITQEKEYMVLLKQYNETKQPDISHLKQRAKYDRQAEELQNLRIKTSEARAEFDKQQQDYFVFANSPETKEKIAEIQREILTENKSVRDKFYALLQEQERLVAIISHHRSLQNDIFTIRKVWKLSKQIKAEYEKDTTPKPPDIFSDTDIALPQQITVDSLQEIAVEVDTRITALNKKMNEVEEKRKTLALQVVTEQTAERTAWKKYLNDREKAINDAKQNLITQEKEYMFLLKQHNETNRPDISHLKQRAEYDRQTKILQSLKTKAMDARAEFDKQYQDYFVFANSSETKEKIAEIQKEIQEEILAENKPISDEFYAVLQEREKLIAIMNHHKTLRNDILAIRKVWHLTKQIKIEYEKDTVPEPQDVLSDIDITLPQLVTAEGLQKITEEIDVRIANLNTKIKEIEKQKKTLAPQVFSEQTASRAANREYLGDREKTINKARQKLTAQEMQYKTLLEQHNKIKRPSIFNIKQRAEYDQQEKNLQILKVKLTDAQTEFNKQHQEYLVFASSFTAEIEKIQKEIITKNKPYRDRFYALLREREKTVAIIRHYRTLKKEIAKQIWEINKNADPRTVAAELQIAVSKFKRLCREEENRQGFGPARLHTDEDTHGRIR
jgi:hypothetical protein